MSEEIVRAWIDRSPEQIYEMHMRAELAKTHGFKFAFSDAYHPRKNTAKAVK